MHMLHINKEYSFSQTSMTSSKSKAAIGEIADEL
jgi:hypothetical protein